MGWQSAGRKTPSAGAQGFLLEDVQADQHGAGQHEGARPGQRHQVAGEGDARPHQQQGIDLALERYALAFEVVANPGPEVPMGDQPD